MRAAHLAVAHANGGDDDLFRRELVHQQADAHHVGHGIERPDLVEVDLVDRRAVDVRLCRGNPGVDHLRVPADVLRERQRIDSLADLRQPRMAVVGVGVRRLVVVLGIEEIVAVRVLVFVIVAMLGFGVWMAVHGRRRGSGPGVGDGFLLSVDFDGDVRAADAAADGVFAA